MAIRKIPKSTDTYTFYNANPAGKRTGDCAIRAVAAASGLTWDDVVDILAAVAHEKKTSPGSVDTIDEALKRLGFEKHRQPRKTSGKKYTGAEFCKLLGKSGERVAVVANIGGHHEVAILADGFGDYKVRDIWDSTGGCIGNYWTRSV